MKDLIILGASGAGRELYNMALECDGYNRDWKIKGFLDDNIHVLDNYSHYPSVIDSISNYHIEENDVFICSVGAVKVKNHIVNNIRSRGGGFISLIHSGAVVSNNSTIGTGSIVSPYTMISCDVKVGNFVTIQSYAVLGHDVLVGDYGHIGAFAFLGGHVHLEENVTIHPGGKIIPSLTIGEGAIIGAGSIVIRDVPSHISVFGIPASRI